VRAALLLEGAAHAYLRAEVPMPRKCAIHMVLAGHRFNQAQVSVWAIRAASSVRGAVLRFRADCLRARGCAAGAPRRVVESATWCRG
jgi:hypothetical protein